MSSLTAFVEQVRSVFSHSIPFLLVTQTGEHKVDWKRVIESSLASLLAAAVTATIVLANMSGRVTTALQDQNRRLDRVEVKLDNLIQFDLTQARQDLRMKEGQKK